MGYQAHFVYLENTKKRINSHEKNHNLLWLQFWNRCEL